MRKGLRTLYAVDLHRIEAFKHSRNMAAAFKDMLSNEHCDTRTISYFGNN